MLSLSIEVKDPFYLEAILKYGGDPNQHRLYRNEETISPLWDAIFSTTEGQSEKLNILVKYGADIEEKNKGRKAVDVCASMNNYENVYTLLKAGASYSINRKPYSLLYCIETYAVHPKDPECVWLEKVVELLQENGLEVTPKEWKCTDQSTIINIQVNE